jgi:adenosine deaminase
MDPAALRLLPKAVLHDHLDGGLRPATVLDLALESGYGGLPTSDPEKLAEWFFQGGSPSLVAYLAAFRQTVAVMQTAGSLERVALEAVQDLAADGVVYAELRFAPMLHLEGGLTPEAVLAAVLGGVAAGRMETGLTAFVIVDAMRQDHDSMEVADLALRYADRGVVGFDLAGPEAGFPAARHIEALRRAQQGGLHLTIHAGEAAGVESIEDALSCGAERLGHGVRLVEDLTLEGAEVVAMGPVATRVRASGVSLEVCPSSNVHTGAFSSVAAVPLGVLHRGGLGVTVNTDNRLMSATSMTKELELTTEYHAFTIDDLQAVTLRAIDAAFCDPSIRESVRKRVVTGFAAT